MTGYPTPIPLLEQEADTAVLHLEARIKELLHAVHSDTVWNAYTNRPVRGERTRAQLERIGLMAGAIADQADVAAGVCAAIEERRAEL